MYRYVGFNPILKGRRNNFVFIVGVWALYLCVNYVAEAVKPVPPFFQKTSDPIQKGREGGSLFLLCIAGGIPPPAVTWRKDGRKIISGTFGIEINGGELRIESLQRTHAGRYVCRAQSVQGYKQHTTIVDVSAPPQIITRPEDARRVEGQDVTFNCAARGYPTDIEYRWYHNGRPVSQSVSLRGRHKVLDSGTLVIRKVNIADKGSVTCEASNGYGSPPTASANLIIEFAARVVGMPLLRYAGVTRSAKLYCPSVSEPPVNRVVWKKNGFTLRVQQNLRLATDANGSLIIHTARRSDEGRYTCIPYNRVGTKGNSTTRLVIRDLPRFVVKPPSLFHTQVGNYFETPCVGVGDPQPAVSWRKVKSKTATLTFCVEGGNLSITSVRKEHHGTWQCVLSNEFGDVTTDVMIVVGNTTPQEAENVTAKAIDDSSIRVTWDPGYDGGSRQHFNIWYKIADKGDHRWDTQFVNGDQKMAVVKRLMPSTVYQVSVSSQNHRGTAFSETVTLKTKDVVVVTPAPRPEIPVPDLLNSTTTKDGLVVLSWTPPTNFPELLGFLIEYRRVEKIEKPAEESLISRTDENGDTKRKSKRSAENQDQAIVTSFDVMATRQNQSVTSLSWDILSEIPSNNVTSYEIKADEMYRDQIYEFRVLAVTKTDYSEPSPPMSISTEGLAAYPCYVEPVPPSDLALSNSVIIGVLSGLLLMCVIIVVVVACVCRNRTLKQDRKNKRLEGSTNDNGFGTDKERPRVEDVINDKRHVITNDGFASSPSFTRRRPDDAYTSSTGSDVGKNLHQFVRDFNEVEERLSLLYSNSCSEENKDPGSFRRRSKDDESVRRRREAAARVLYAQKAERRKFVAGIKDAEYAPIMRPSSATPMCPSFHDQSTIGSRHTSDVTDRKSSFTRQLSLDDKRHLGTSESAVESVFGLVGSAPIKRQTSFVHNSYQVSDAKRNSFLDQQDPLRHQYVTTLPNGAFSPCYGKNDDVIASCCATSHVPDLPLQHVPLLSSSPAKAVVLRHNDDSMTSSSNRSTRAASVSPEQTRILRRPRSRASYSFDYSRDTTARHSLNKSLEEALASSEQPSFEIDCSNSNIEVRFVKARQRQLTERNRRSTDREFKYATYKVGSNSLEEAGQAIPPQRTSSPLKTQMRTNLKDRDESAKRNRVSLEALLSPTQILPESESQPSSIRSRQHSAITKSRPRSIHESPVKEARNEDHISPTRDLGDRTPTGVTDRPSRESTISKLHQYVSEKRMTLQPSPERLKRSFEQPTTSTPISKDDVMQIAKPTVISLSDISWETTRRRKDSGSITSTLSPLSPELSPSKRNMGLSSSRRTTPKTSPVKEWGSLGRPCKLKKLSLPLSPTHQQAAVPTLGGKKTQSFASLSTGKVTHESTHRTGRSPGVRSLPVSPIKKFTLDLSKSPNKSRDSPNKTIVPFDGHSRVEAIFGVTTSTKGVNDSLSQSFLTSSPTSRVRSPVSFRRHRNLGESLSSGYVTQDTTQSTPDYGSSTMSNAERTRRDNSSVEDNYEWDSEYAMESEILEALRNFESLKSTTSMSEELRDELSKFANDVTLPRQPSTNQGTTRNTEVTLEPSTSPIIPHSSAEDSAMSYTKESMERRCAALRQEFLHFQRLQEEADATDKENLPENQNNLE